MNNETVLLSRSFPFFSFLLLFSVCLCQLREHYASPQVIICNIFLLILELLRRASVVAPHFSGRADSASSFLHCTTGWIAGISLFSHDVHSENLPVQMAQLLHWRGTCLSTNFQPQLQSKELLVFVNWGVLFQLIPWRLHINLVSVIAGFLQFQWPLLPGSLLHSSQEDFFDDRPGMAYSLPSIISVSKYFISLW